MIDHDDFRELLVSVVQRLTDEMLLLQRRAEDAELRAEKAENEPFERIKELETELEIMNEHYDELKETANKEIDDLNDELAALATELADLKEGKNADEA